MCTACSKSGHFKVVCRSSGAKAMNEVEQEAVQDGTEDNGIVLVNIKSIHFIKNSFVITVKLKLSAGINNVIVPYKVDNSSDSNIMPLHIYKTLFPIITSGQFVATKK